MTRWNVETIFFLGVNGERRDVSFKAEEVNIITGASGTGKSTLIKALDYCLGSKNCELPVHVKRRCVAVGVKWVRGDNEMIVGRIIPPVGQKSSAYMFAANGRNLALPNSLEAFEGATNLATAKGFLERAFGIGDLPDDADTTGAARGRATVRHVTPYLFVTKEVIYSETVLLHGLEDKDKASDIVETLPYFLKVADEGSAADERELRQLRKSLQHEEQRERQRLAEETVNRDRAFALVSEGHSLGLLGKPEADLSEETLMSQLRGVSSAVPGLVDMPSDSELGPLYERRRILLADLNRNRREQQAARVAVGEAQGFKGAVSRQRNKLMLAEHLGLDSLASHCPICESETDKGQEAASAISAALEKIRDESAAVERVEPRLQLYGRQIAEENTRLRSELKRLDDDIAAALRRIDESGKFRELQQVQAHFMGRVSYFLEAPKAVAARPARDLSVLRTQIANLEARVDRGAREVRLRSAENQVSSYASEAFKVLPTVEPCNGARLMFSARKPDIAIIEKGTEAVLRMPDVGSDQNYLAVHIALAFALQRHFEERASPVPGLLVLDQISRPYFPAREDGDETEVSGRPEDDDIIAMRKHIDYLFAEVASRTGLQVILIEHAYFADDARYVNATRERWTRPSKRALIPLDWPERPDHG